MSIEKKQELRQKIVTNFADKRDKGFPFLSSSIASLHAKCASTEIKKLFLWHVTLVRKQSLRPAIRTNKWQ
jgi:hypothetical protein